MQSLALLQCCSLICSDVKEMYSFWRHLESVGVNVQDAWLVLIVRPQIHLVRAGEAFYSTGLLRSISCGVGLVTYLLINQDLSAKLYVRAQQWTSWSLS